MGKPKLAMCGNCKGFFGSAHLWRHKRNCTVDGASNTESVGSDLPAHLLTKALSSSKVAEENSFAGNVLARFRSDECGSLCSSDKLITNVGEYHYSKCPKKRVLAMTSMRRLGNLLLKFREAADDDSLSGEEMLRRKFFPQLHTAIDLLCNENASLKVAIGYLIKTACDVMKGVYLIENNDLLAKEVEDFKSVLDLFWGRIFASAVETVELRRQERLRKPARLPAEYDVARVREHMCARLNALLSDEYLQWSSSEYSCLRSLIVSRLTLFNARRGGEPARLTLQEWKDAEQDAWIDQQLIQNVEDPLEKGLLGKFKLAYMSGKGTKYLVPVLIPIDLVPAIKKLVEIRDIVGVRPDNPYLFANMQNSLDYVSGWQCVRDVCKAAGIENHSRLTATTMRHRASTLYALEDVPEQERESFYRHMGHGKDVNKLVYQAPLGVQEVCKMGKYFQKLDNENIEANILSVADSQNDSSDATDLDDVEDEDNSGVSAPHCSDRVLPHHTASDTFVDDTVSEVAEKAVSPGILTLDRTYGNTRSSVVRCQQRQRMNGSTPRPINDDSLDMDSDYLPGYYIGTLICRYLLLIHIRI